mmetsp:Transcript_4545/g.8848  ORF Transcript_4545/g.8848 Transcript_4545/m.8848 type:complete len:95 (+) Transcript_4545:217-501(+)
MRCFKLLKSKLPVSSSILFPFSSIIGRLRSKTRRHSNRCFSQILNKVVHFPEELSSAFPHSLEDANNEANVDDNIASIFSRESQILLHKKAIYH